MKLVDLVLVNQVEKQIPELDKISAKISTII